MSVAGPPLPILPYEHDGDTEPDWLGGPTRLVRVCTLTDGYDHGYGGTEYADA